MDVENCERKARKRLKEEEAEARPRVRRDVAREMCRLLESGLLEEDLENQPPGIEYLISRLEVRDGDDNPTLKAKWNSWTGQMAFFNEGDYNHYQV